MTETEKSEIEVLIKKCTKEYVDKAIAEIIQSSLPRPTHCRICGVGSGQTGISPSGTCGYCG